MSHTGSGKMLLVADGGLELELAEYAVAAALVAVATVAAFELLGTSIAARTERLAGFIQ